MTKSLSRRQRVNLLKIQSIFALESEGKHSLTKVAPDALYSATFHIQCADTQRMDLPSEIGCFSIKWSDEQGEQGFLQTCPIHSEVYSWKDLLVVGDRSIPSRAFLYSSPFLNSSSSARLLRVLFEEYDRQCMLWKREEMNRIMRSPWTGLLLSPISVFWVNLVMYEFISCWWIL